MDLRRLVEASGRELDTGEIGLLDQIREGDFVLTDAHAIGKELHLLGADTPFLCREGDQPLR